MRAVFSAAILLLAASIAFGQDELPEVLVLADTVHRQAASAAAKELKDQAKIEVSRTNIGDTGRALAQLDELLGEKNWDLIYFNFGFADLHYRDPSTETIRAMSKAAGGVRVSTPERYEANLRKIVERLNSTGASLVWASTTPIHSSKLDNLYDPGSEIEFNRIAAEIMRENEIPVIDLHAWIVENVENKQDPSPFTYNRIALHPPIVEGILAILP